MTFQDNDQTTVIDAPTASEVEGIPPTIILRTEGIVAIPGEGAQFQGSALSRTHFAVEAIKPLALRAGWKYSSTKVVENFVEVSFVKVKQGDFFQPKVSAEDLPEWIVETLESAGDEVNRQASGESVDTTANSAKSTESSVRLDPETFAVGKKALKTLVELGVSVASTIDAKAVLAPAISSFGHQPRKEVEPVSTKVKFIAFTPDWRYGIDMYFNRIDLGGFAGDRSIQVGDELEGPFIIGSPTPTRKIIPVANTQFTRTSRTGEVSVIQPKQIRLLPD